LARELRDRAAAEDWLGAGLCLMRLTSPSPTALDTVSPWLTAAHSEIGALPPPGFVADFGQALTGGVRDFTPSRASSAAGLRGALRLYEDQVLGRLGADPRLDLACDAMARLSEPLKREAVAVLLSSLLTRVGYDAGVAFNPGITRQLAERHGPEVLERGFAQLSQPGEVVDALADGYERLVRATRHAGALLTDADLFILENLAVLRTLSQRLSIQQVAEVAQELERSLPRRIRKSTRAGARTATQIEDEDKYPIGGFASMSTSGSIENLVTSELVYMDDAPQEIDLFDMRYVEGELLYYTRDESVFLRNRHVLTFALGNDLAKARFKDPGARWQRLVMVLGLVLCLVRRLSDWLSDEGLLFRVAFVGVGSALGPEKELLTLILREWIEKGMAEVVQVPDLAGLLADAAVRARTAECDVLAIGVGSELPEADRRVQLLGLDVSQASPLLAGAGLAEREEAKNFAWEAWTGALATLVQRLV
jgi:hypothetical protein